MREISSAGVIGFGNAGPRHALAYAKAGLTTLAYDPDVEAYCGEYEGDTLDEVLACDVVSICSPDDTHVEYLNRIPSTCKGILVEKPLTHDTENLLLAERFAEQLQYEGVVVDCHLPLRYHPPFVQALGEIKSGSLGKIISIDMAYHYGRPEKMKGWRGKIPGYSLIVGGGIHLVDLAVQIAEYEHTEQLAVFQAAAWDTRSTFMLGDILCTLATTCHEHVQHMQALTIVGTAGVINIPNTAEVDHSIGVRLFLDKVRNGQRGNIAEAIAANRICIQLAEALR